MSDNLLTDEILFNLIQDFKKRDISMELKFKLTEELRQRKNLSTRDVCKSLDIGRTSYYAWKRAAELGSENHDKLIEHGWSETEIQNELKSHTVGHLVNKVTKKKIDLFIEEAISNLNQFVHKKDYSSETSMKIKELQNVLNRILMRVEK
jgi:hypothetical protein